MILQVKNNLENGITAIFDRKISLENLPRKTYVKSCPTCTNITLIVFDINCAQTPIGGATSPKKAVWAQG